MKKEIFEKFLNNKCTEEELLHVSQWVKRDAFNLKSRSWVKQDWKTYDADDNILNNEEFTSLLDSIHHQININSSKHRMPKNKVLSLSAITTWGTRVAAVLLLPVLAFLFYTMPEGRLKYSEYSELAVDSIEIVSPIGSKTIVTLSDGTQVHLNHGSKLKYPQRFNGEVREVILSGEGYFDVAHNPEIPFVVKTRKLNIVAVGTEFDVLAYPDEDVIETTLVEGKVIVEKSEINNGIKSISTMVPNQHLSYNVKTGQVTNSKGKIEEYVSWKDGKLVFENESIVQIATKLSRWYNVDFEFKDDIIREYTYTAMFNEETLSQILEYMEIATPINFEFSPRVKLANGSLSKQKILIGKK